MDATTGRRPLRATVRWAGRVLFAVAILAGLAVVAAGVYLAAAGP